MLNKSLRCAVFALALLSVLPRQGLDASDDHWAGEAGTLVGHHTNFFFRGEGAPAPSANLVTMYATAVYETELRRGELQLLFGGSQVLVTNIDNANYPSLNFGAEFKQGRYRLSGEYGLSLNRLYSEEGDAVFFDVDAAEFTVRRRLDAKTWIRGDVDIAGWDFDPVEQRRDSTITRFTATFRRALSGRVGLRGELMYETRNAMGKENSRTGPGFGVALESTPLAQTNLFIRYRRRARNYGEAPPSERNFERDDMIDTVSVNFIWRIHRDWGLQLQNYYRRGASTRLDRNYSGNMLAGGVFYVF